MSAVIPTKDPVLSIDQLDRNIVRLAARINTATCELSYSKVRPLTRVARRENEASLLAFALKTTASRVEERCRELRCARLPQSMKPTARMPIVRFACTAMQTGA